MDKLKAARGFLIGVLICAAFWALFIAIAL